MQVEFIYSVPDDLELFRFCSTVKSLSKLDELSQVVKSGTTCTNISDTQQEAI